MHHRTRLKYYIRDMLINDVEDVSSKVFLNRPNPVFLNEAPCILIYFDAESVVIESGDKYCAHEYERTAVLNIDVMTLEGEDNLDYLGGKVEWAFKNDQFLGKRLDGYDADSNRIGLSRGVTLQQVQPYEIDSGSENVIYGQRQTYSVPWIDDLYSNEKWPDWEQYYFEIRKTEENAIDPVLSAGEGNLGE